MWVMILIASSMLLLGLVAARLGYGSWKGLFK